MIRVVVADDNYLAREGVTRALSMIDDVELAGVCGDLESTLRTVAEAGPDVVLTDIRMPPSNTDEGLQLAARLRETQPAVGVILLSQHAEPSYVLELFDPTPERRGYLLKERIRSHQELSIALHHVADGSSYVDPAIVTPLLQSRPDTHLDRLTPREREILGLIAQAASNSAIADATGVTKRAVERHINAIFQKLELTDGATTNRRVKAALTYLAEVHTGGQGAPPSGRSTIER
jgi:DNA-binding NarL/FixJ family response regulator